MLNNIYYQVQVSNMYAEDDKILNTSDALEYVEELKSQRVTRVRDGYNCDLTLDIGEFIHKDKTYPGKYSISTGLNWRLETENSILMGSSSPEHEIIKLKISHLSVD